MRVTHMHGSSVSAVRVSSSLYHLTFSLLMFHPSLLLLFLDGHFETTPDYDLTDFDVHDFLSNFPYLEAQVKRTPHEDELFGCLATSVPNTVLIDLIFFWYMNKLARAITEWTRACDKRLARYSS